jgi:uncharacterized membrane protein YfcA
MLDTLLPGIDPTILISAVAITMVAGIVKGVIGFAMPLIMVSGLTSVMDPKLALAAIILPIVFSNGLQTFRKGVRPAIEAARQYWRYLVMVCIAIFLAAQLVPTIPTGAFFLILGIPVIVLASIQLAGWRPSIPEAHRAAAEWIIGTVSGILGGLAGTWGPTTVLYLLAVNTPKAQQILVQGVVYGLGSLTLLVAHLQSGILNRETAPLSAALLIPALIGMWLGFQIQDRINHERFRQITLIVLVIAGLNLIRRGVFG